MTAKNKDDQALELALEVADAAAQAEAGRDPQLHAARQAWERRLARLGAAVPPEAPPAGLWPRILRSLDQEPPALAGAVTVRADDGGWQPLVEGVQVKLLAYDPAAGRRCFLLRMEPGATLPSHAHDRPEECLMLAGDIAFGEVELKAGDFQYLPAGVSHPAGVSRGGCVAYVSGSL